MPRQQPPQQPPPAMKMLVKYGKTGPARFSSHRDFTRAFERALRRAEIPMAYSSGFNPHQRVSYVNPAPTGAESVAEYLVISLSQMCDPADVIDALNRVMPPGLPVLEVSRLTGEARFDVSLWEVWLPGATAVSLREALAYVDPRSAGPVMVSRETKNGLRTFDIMGALERISVSAPERVALVIRHTEPLVRPDDVVAAMMGHCPHLGDGTPPRMIRHAQGDVEALTAMDTGLW